MAVFTYLSTTDWNYYGDFAGGAVLTQTATVFRYTSTAGLTITLRGNGFAYDGEGIATAGTITRMEVVKSGVDVGLYTGLTTALAAFVTLAFGQTSGQPDTPVSTVNLYTLLQVGDDVINGNDLGKTLVGNAGDDTIFGNGGDDWMQGAAGVDRYYGGIGRNGVYFDGAAGILHGISVDLGKANGNILDDGYGNTETATLVQMIGGSSFGDVILGGAANEFLYGAGGDDSISGGSGNDLVRGGDGTDTLSGGSGNDWLSFSDSYAGSHGVVLDFGQAANVIDDGSGHVETVSGFEYVAGSAFADTMTASKAGMLFQGNDGNDSLKGGKGNDVLYGGAGDDTLIGGGGYEVILGGKGRDRMVAGGGNDYLSFTDVDATGHGIVVNLGTGRVQDDGYGNREVASGFERLQATSFADHLTGSNGSNQIWGYAGNDTIFGGGDFDQLDGGSGKDRLVGGSNIDTLTGGRGNDTLTGGADTLDFFYFNDVTPGPGDADHITDFQAGQDIIVINTAWAADIAVGVLQASQFLSGAGVTAATTAQQRILYDSNTGSLYFDSDGTGAAAAQLFAILDNQALLDRTQISAITTTIDPI